MKIEKSHMSKSKPCFEIFWYLENFAFFNDFQMFSSKFNGVVVEGGGGEGQGRFFFWNLTLFLIFNLKILPIWFSQVSRCHLKAFFPKDFKTGLTFWHMWFSNFQNLVRICQHIGGTKEFLKFVKSFFRFSNFMSHNFHINNLVLCRLWRGVTFQILILITNISISQRFQISK